MTSAVEELLSLLQLERLEDNLFRGESRDIGTRYVFGGQVLGQALSAAQQTVEPDRSAHSLHAYFLRAGDIDKPIVYHVERTRDGGSFSMRRVTAIQHGQPIFNFAASFQVDEPGVEHQLPMRAAWYEQGQRQFQACPVAWLVDPVASLAARTDDALVFVESDGARRN